MKITVNVVDGLYGRPAEGISVSVDQQVNGKWKRAVSGATDENGQLPELQDASPLGRGIYHLEFDVDHYYSALGLVPLQVRVSVVVRVPDSVENDHISALITPSAVFIHRNVVPA